MLADLAAAGEQVLIGVTYCHYKSTSSRYIVEKLCIIESSEEVGVLYSPVSTPDITFLRPLSSWTEEVDGKPRFKQIDE